MNKLLQSLVQPPPHDWSREPFRRPLERAHHDLEIAPRHALAQFRELADKGSLTAMEYLNHFYETGTHVGRSRETAEYWSRRAAEEGPVLYTYKLANFFHATGHPEKAAQAYRTASQQRFVPAMLALAAMLRHGKDVSPDRREARHWLEIADRAGSLPGRLMLGFLLVRSWYNPLRLVRGLYLVARSVPRIGALLREDAAPTRPETPVPLGQRLLDSAIPLGSALLALLYAGSWLFGYWNTWAMPAGFMLIMTTMMIVQFWSENRGRRREEKGRDDWLYGRRPPEGPKS